MFSRPSARSIANRRMSRQEPKSVSGPRLPSYGRGDWGGRGEGGGGSAAESFRSRLACGTEVPSLTVLSLRAPSPPGSLLAPAHVPTWTAGAKQRCRWRARNTDHSVVLRTAADILLSTSLYSLGEKSFPPVAMGTYLTTPITSPYRVAQDSEQTRRPDSE